MLAPLADTNAVSNTAASADDVAALRVLFTGDYEARRYLYSVCRWSGFTVGAAALTPA